MEKKRIVKVFVSSTFREMISERDEIQQIVFTKIRFWARKLGILVCPIDLRWGITEEDILEGKLAEQCEEAIEFCEPYFIALLGKTYGTDSKKVLGNVGKDYYGKSVTDYEITKGVLEKKNSKALIYRLTYSNARENIIKRSKLNKLLKNISQDNEIIDINLYDRLVSTMINDLKKMLEADFAEDYYHDNYTKDNFFVKSCYYSQYYNTFFSTNYYGNYFKNESKKVLVDCKEKASISVFLYNYAFSYLKEEKNTRILYHDFCVSVYNRNYEGFLKHLVDFFSTETNIYYYSSGNIIDDASSAMASMANINQKYVFIIDALYLLDKIEADKIVNFFLGKEWENIYVYFSSYEGIDFFKQEFETIYVRELTNSEARCYIEGFLHEYKKDNNYELTYQIVEKIMQSNSFDVSFLQLVLNEVLMKGCPSDKILHEIDGIISANNIDEIASIIIKRLNEKVTTVHDDIIIDICALIATSEHCLLLQDIQYILQKMGYSLQIISEGLELLNDLLIICDNMYRFRFEQIRDAIKRMYNNRVYEIESKYYYEYLKESKKTMHILIELLGYYRRKDDIKKAIDTVFDESVFFMLYHENMALLYSITNNNQQYSSTCIVKLAEKISEKPTFINILIEFTINSGLYAVATIIIDRFMEKYPQICLLKKAYLEREKANYSEAICLLERYIVTFSDASEQELVTAYDYLAYCYGKVNEDNKAIQFSKSAIELRRKYLGRLEFDLPVSLNSLAYTYFKQKRYEDAVMLYEEACNIRIRYLGTKHPRVAANINNKGKVYLRKKQFGKAMECFSTSYKILIETIGASHIYTLICKMNCIMTELVLEKKSPEELLSEVVNVKTALCATMQDNDYIAYANMLIGCIKKIYKFGDGISDLKAALNYYQINLGQYAYESEFVKKVIEYSKTRMEDYFE